MCRSKRCLCSGDDDERDVPDGADETPGQHRDARERFDVIDGRERSVGQAEDRHRLARDQRRHAPIDPQLLEPGDDRPPGVDQLGVDEPGRSCRHPLARAR